MFRPMSSTEPLSSSSIKTSTVQSLTDHKSIQKHTNIHFTEYPSLQEKGQKKGLMTSVVYSNQSPSMQNSQQNFTFSIKPQQSVYQQYLKSLQSEISSRERQRLELHRNLQDLKNENSLIFNQLNEEKKKSATLIKTKQQLELFLKQSEERKRLLNNQKEHIFKQYQVEVMRCKNMQGNEMKLRSGLQNLQKQLETTSKKQNEVIRRLKQEIQQQKLRSQRFCEQLNLISILSNQQKQRLHQIAQEKTKLIETFNKEKHTIQVYYQKQHKEHLETHTNQIKEKQQVIKFLNKRMVDIQQANQLQVDRLKYRISEFQFQNRTMKKDFQASRENSIRQLDQTNKDNEKLRTILSQFERDKIVNGCHNKEVNKELEKLQNEVNLLVKQKLTLEKECAQERQRLEQSHFFTLKKLQESEQQFQSKQIAHEQLFRHHNQLQAEYDRHKILSAQQFDQIARLNLQLRQQLTAKQADFSVEVARIEKQKEHLNEVFNFEVKRIQQEANEHMTREVESIRIKAEQVRGRLVIDYEEKISEKKKEIEGLCQQISLNQAKYQKEIDRLTAKFETSIATEHQSSLESQLSVQHSHNLLITQKQSTITQLSTKLIEISLQQESSRKELQRLKEILHEERKRFQGIERQLRELKCSFSKQEVEIRGEFELSKRMSEIEKGELIKENGKLSKELAYFHHGEKELQSLVQKLKQQKQSLSLQILKSQEHSANAIFDLRNQLINFQQEKVELECKLKEKQREMIRKLEDSAREWTAKVNQTVKEKKQLQAMIVDLQKNIQEVVLFAQKYSGQNIIDERSPTNNEHNDFFHYDLNGQDDKNDARKRERSSSPSRVCAKMNKSGPIQYTVKNTQQNITQNSNTAPIFQHTITVNSTNASHYRGPLNSIQPSTPFISSSLSSTSFFQISKQLLQQITNFIGERLYIITILTHEATTLKQEIQQKNQIVHQFEQKIILLTEGCKLMKEQKQMMEKEIIEVKKSIDVKSLQNGEVTSKLKENVASYKKQLARYEAEIQQISLKVEIDEVERVKLEERIAELQEEIEHEKDKAKKMSINHVKQLNQVNDQHLQHLETIKQQLHKQFQDLLAQQQSKLASTIQSYQQKLKHQQKIVENKEIRLIQLESHYKLQIQRQKEENQSEIEQHQREIRFLQSKVDSQSESLSPTKVALLQKRLQFFEEQIQKKQGELQILEGNNALLRKNLITSINQQQSLREEVKLNRSQKSLSSRSKSKELNSKNKLYHSIQNGSQQKYQDKESFVLKNKDYYLRRRPSYQKDSEGYQLQPNQSHQEDLQRGKHALGSSRQRLLLMKGSYADRNKGYSMSGLGPRSYSNSQLNSQNNNNSRRFESPKSFQYRVGPLNVSGINQIMKQPQIETDRPVSSNSTVQKSVPHIPLDLKRIRQRNQKYFQSSIQLQKTESMPLQEGDNSYEMPQSIVSQRKSHFENKKGGNLVVRQLQETQRQQQNQDLKFETNLVVSPIKLLQNKEKYFAAKNSQVMIKVDRQEQGESEVDINLTSS